MNTNYQTKFNILIIALLIINKVAFSQNFELANLPALTVPSNQLGVGRTSCDITVHQFNSTTRYVFQIMAFDGSSPGWYYDVIDFTTQAPISSGVLNLLHTDAINPDICIMAEKEASVPHRVYVLIIYQRATVPGIWVAHYKWNNTTQVFQTHAPVGLSHQVNLSAGTISSPPQIDANRYDHFAGCWAESGSNQVRACAGSLTSGDIHYDCYNKELEPVSYVPTPPGVTNPYPCIQPDVCVGSDNNNNGEFYMHFVFKTADNFICTQDYRSGDLCTALGQPRESFIIDGGASGYDYNHPRIASPRDLLNPTVGNQTQYGYGVVYEKTNTTTGITDICGRVSWCKVALPVICTFSNIQTYTDGNCLFHNTTTKYLPNISGNGVAITKPVICYDSFTGTYNPNANANGNSIVVGFNYNDGTLPIKPAAFYANVETAQPQWVSGLGAGNYIYQNVSDNISNNQSHLSMAGESDQTNVVGSGGQNYKKMLYCWYDLDNQQVLYKTVQNVGHFRIASTTGNLYFEVSPNPITENIRITGIESSENHYVTLCTIEGKIVYQKIATGFQLEADLNSMFSTTPNGFYFLQIKNSDGNIGIAKLIINH